MAITEQQRKDRLTGIGASYAAALLDYYLPMGCYQDGRRDPFTNAEQVYNEIVGGHEREITPAMREGMFVESAILDWAEYVLGFDKGALLRDQMRRHSGGILLANFDALSDAPHQKFTVEAKWKRYRAEDRDDPRLVWGRAAVTDPSRATDQVPPRTYVQVQAGLAVAGYDLGYVAVLRGDKGFGMYRVERDERTCDTIVKCAERLWHEHVLPKHPPCIKKEMESMTL